MLTGERTEVDDAGPGATPGNSEQKSSNSEAPETQRVSATGAAGTTIAPPEIAPMPEPRTLAVVSGDAAGMSGIRTASVPPQPGAPRRPPGLLAFGYYSSTILVLLCLAAAAVMSYIVVSRAALEEPDALLIRLALSCIAIFIGLAFACLGFGLFLIQAEGALDAQHEGAGQSTRSRISVTAPGLAVVICATCIIYFALQVQFTIQRPIQRNGRQSATGGAVPIPTHESSDSDETEPLGGDVQ